MRIVFICYLVVTTACGPVFCCCAPSQAISAVKLFFAGERGIGNGGYKHVCCGTSRHPAGPTNDTSKPAKPCPCKEFCGNHNLDVAVRLTESFLDYSALKHILDSVAVPSSFESVVSVGLFAIPNTTIRYSFESCACPRAPHVLRC